MKKAFFAAVTLAAIAVCGSASAQGYVGASVGQSRADIDCSGTSTCDKNDSAFKIYGGYMFMPYVGIEATYYNQGKAHLAGSDPSLGNFTLDFKGDGFGVYARGVYPVGNLQLFGKLGIVSANIKGDATSSLLGVASDSERSTNVAYGLGLEYGFTKNIAGRAEWERMRVKFQGEKVDVDLLTVGVTYRF